MGYGGYSANGLRGRNEAPVPADLKQRKQVFGSHAQLAHVWAQRQHKYGRSADGRMFFDRDAIFSYGHHFPIARFIERKGHVAVLFTAAACSVSTSKHIGHVRQALPRHLTVFAVENPVDVDMRRTWNLYQLQVSEHVAAFAKLRSAWIDVDQELANIRGRVNHANAFREFFGLRAKPLAYPDIPAEIIEATRARVAAAKVRQADKVVKAAQADIARAEKQFAAWHAGEPNVGYLPGPVLLRVRGDNVETSHGAVFPVAHARLAFTHVNGCRVNGTTWQLNGHSIRLGEFKIDRIDADGTVHAGCHVVRWPEIERVAWELGLLP